LPDLHGVNALRPTLGLFLLALLYLSPAAGTAGDADQAVTKRQIDLAVSKLDGYTTIYSDKRLAIQFRFPGPDDKQVLAIRQALASVKRPFVLNLNQSAKVTDAGVEHLKDWTTLAGLALGGTQMTDKSMPVMASLPGLETLYLAPKDDAITDEGLASLSKLTKLRHLSVYSKKLTQDSYRHLAGLTELEELATGNDLGDVALKHMQGMKKLRVLSIGSTKAGQGLTDEGLASLQHHPLLRKLRITHPGEFIMREAQFGAKGLATLSALKELEALTLYGCPALESNGLAGVKDLQRLRELEIIASRQQLTAASTAHLTGLQGLRRLRLDNVADEALLHVARIPNLEELDLTSATFRAKGLAHLAGMKSLVTLNLGYTRTTDEGLAHLKGITGLRKLYLFNTQVTDPGLSHLEGLKNLKELFLGGSKVTKSGVETLRKALGKGVVVSFN
jgi:internalin A